MRLWLDDKRNPKNFEGFEDYVWVKTADDAIEQLKTGAVEFASLDHDLSEGQERAGACAEIDVPEGEKSGYDVVLWLENNPDYWPVNGVQCHTLNPAGRQRMETVIYLHYGRIWPFSIFTVRYIRSADVIA